MRSRDVGPVEFLKICEPDLRRRKRITFRFDDRLKINVWEGLRARHSLRYGIFAKNDGSSGGAGTEARTYIPSHSQPQIGT